MAEDGEHALKMELVQAYSATARLANALLVAMVQRGVVTEDEAASMVENAMGGLPSDHPVRPAFEDLVRQYRP